jgi:beta-phosphoglucomutase-like phosphatase (HAD superfamily)
MHLHAAIFDMDGTLIDSERIILNAWVESSREIGVPLDSVEYSQVIGLNDEESKQLLVSLLGSEATFLVVRSLAKNKLRAQAGNVVCPGLITSYTQIGGNHLGKKSDEFKTKSLRRKLQAASR